MKSMQESLIERLRHEQRKVLVDFDQVKAGREYAHFLNEEVKTPDVLMDEGYDPLHAVYLYAQNFLSVLVEQAVEFPELQEWVKLYVSLEKDYMPAGPPMSPLSRSYFFCWSSFDLPFGGHQETITDCMIKMTRELGSPDGLVETLEVMQQSRMGFYVHEGMQGEYIQLRELKTNRLCLCHCSSGYQGGCGEIWYIRLMPPLVEGYDYHVAFTTPYVVRNITESGLLKLIDRMIPKMATRGYPADYDSFMKWGPALKYWNEYLTMGYSNFAHDVIYLTGYPSTDPKAEYRNVEDMNSYPSLGSTLLGWQGALAPGIPKPATKKIVQFAGKKKKQKQAKQARKRNRK
ncbi:hypothetical protein [Endozoicomonas ascidiicola]|uniref:hypothetical protein n=1 Tax=Endozoicomonas ascidiicola TaxID=1698521 RepID=UPI000AC87CC8|nr:hypothetical protein [Endozoicomonas ascidiicola]